MKTLDVPADGEETTSVKPVRHQYTVKKKQRVTLFCMLNTTELVSPKGRLVFRKRTSNVG